MISDLPFFLAPPPQLTPTARVFMSPSPTWLRCVSLGLNREIMLHGEIVMMPFRPLYKPSNSANYERKDVLGLCCLAAKTLNMYYMKEEVGLAILDV